MQSTLQNKMGPPEHMNPLRVKATAINTQFCSFKVGCDFFSLVVVVKGK